MLIILVQKQNQMWLKNAVLIWQRIIIRYCNTSFPCGSAGKESSCNVGNLGSVLGLGRSPGEGKGYSPQFRASTDWPPVQSMESQRVRHDWATFTFHCDERTNPKGFFDFCVYYTWCPSQGWKLAFKLGESLETLS